MNPLLTHLRFEVAHGSDIGSRENTDPALFAVKNLSTKIGIPAGLIELGNCYGGEFNANDVEDLTVDSSRKF